ncbi:hypothetical protein NIES25_23710 [Nostoc linckia NIES-25]|nr:hypothetical protein NIES25_23710 [Nostoc linckia NIES-25]
MVLSNKHAMNRRLYNNQSFVLMAELQGYIVVSLVLAFCGKR